MDLDLLDALEDRIGQARQIPLTGDVRLDPEDIKPLIQELGVFTRGTTAEKPVSKLERLALNGRKVPLADQVRFSRRKALKLLDKIRSNLAVGRMH